MEGDGQQRPLSARSLLGRGFLNSAPTPTLTCAPRPPPPMACGGGGGGGGWSGSMGAVAKASLQSLSGFEIPSVRTSLDLHLSSLIHGVCDYVRSFSLCRSGLDVHKPAVGRLWLPKSHFEQVAIPGGHVVKIKGKVQFSNSRQSSDSNLKLQNRITLVLHLSKPLRF